MVFHSYGNKTAPSLMLLPGLGISHEMFLPLIELLREDFHIIAVEADGFILDKPSHFTSIDDQAAQANRYVKDQLGGHLDAAYGLCMGGKILSRMMERDEITIDHAVLDAAPLLTLPKWMYVPFGYYKCMTAWMSSHWIGFWKRLFRSHYFHVLLDECRKVWPYGKGKAVRDGFNDVYAHKLKSIKGADIHYWYGSKEAFFAKFQAQHLTRLHPDTHIEVFQGMNHGQLLIDHPEEVAQKIKMVMVPKLADIGKF